MQVRTPFSGHRFFFSYMPGHNSFGYVRGLVTDEEVELIYDSDENDQYLDCKSCVCQLKYS